MSHGKRLSATILGLAASSAFALPVPAQPEQALQPSEAICYKFTEKNWDFRHNIWAKGWPRVLTPGELELLPDNKFNAGAAAVLNNTMRPPFEVTFEFSTYDDDGGPNQVWNSADGIAFFFFKNGAEYGTPPSGNRMGLSRSAGGYAVTLPIYGQRRATLLTADGIELKYVPFRQAYTHGKWVPVRIQVMPNRVIVKGDKWLLMDTSFNFDTQHSALGFSAATGAADSQHKVRNFCIRSLASPVQSQEIEKKIEELPEPDAVIPAQEQDIKIEASFEVPLAPDNTRRHLFQLHSSKQQRQRKIL